MTWPSQGTIFLEATAISLTGETVVLGDATRDCVWDNMANEMKRVMRAQSFCCELSGDIERNESAMSLSSETPTILVRTHQRGLQLGTGRGADLLSLPNHSAGGLAFAR
jgi:hypothetical protein